VAWILIATKWKKNVEKEVQRRAQTPGKKAPQKHLPVDIKNQPAALYISHKD